VGETEVAKQTKSSRRRGPTIDRDQLLVMLRDVGTDAEVAADALFGWASERPLLDLAWTSKTGDIGMPGRPPLLRVWSDGRLEVRLRSLRDVEPAWDAARCDDLIGKLETIENLRFERGRNWPKASIAPLADPHKRQRFIAVIDDVLRTMNSPADASGGYFSKHGHASIEEGA
jgi:hypothetical protein